MNEFLVICFQTGNCVTCRDHQKRMCLEKKIHMTYFDIVCSHHSHQPLKQLMHIQEKMITTSVGQSVELAHWLAVKTKGNVQGSENRRTDLRTLNTVCKVGRSASSMKM